MAVIGEIPRCDIEPLSSNQRDAALMTIRAAFAGRKHVSDIRVVEAIVQSDAPCAVES